MSTAVYWTVTYTKGNFTRRLIVHSATRAGAESLAMQGRLPGERVASVEPE